MISQTFSPAPGCVLPGRVCGSACCLHRTRLHHVCAFSGGAGGPMEGAALCSVVPSGLRRALEQPAKTTLAPPPPEEDD